MVKHVILWTLKEEFSAEQKAEIKAGIKSSLEALAGKIPGLMGISVYTEGLKSSNAEVMLVSSFESEEALKGYAVHPDHVYAADTFVRPYTSTRLCMDFEV
ncbi:MAG: Dabb family protein [Clostridia bacterium]|nr:Dabb family protein [Clostridia bacterium]